MTQSLIQLKFTKRKTLCTNSVTLQAKRNLRFIDLDVQKFLMATIKVWTKIQIFYVFDMKLNSHWDKLEKMKLTRREEKMKNTILSVKAWGKSLFLRTGSWTKSFKIISMSGNMRQRMIKIRFFQRVECRKIWKKGKKWQ